MNDLPMKDVSAIRLITLLRGVNVSGFNKVPMADLRTVLTNDGFSNVATYIQSGNVALDTDLPPSNVTERIEQLLVEHFDVDVPVVSIPQNHVTNILNAAPFSPDMHPAYQVIYFPAGPVDVAGIEAIDQSKYDGDVITPASDAVYVSYDGGQSTSSLTVNALEKAAGTTLTGRNLRSSAKLVDL